MQDLFVNKARRRARVASVAAFVAAIGALPVIFQQLSCRPPCQTSLVYKAIPVVFMFVAIWSWGGARSAAHLIAAGDYEGGRAEAKRAAFILLLPALLVTSLSLFLAASALYSLWRISQNPSLDGCATLSAQIALAFAGVLALYGLPATLAVILLFLSARALTLRRVAEETAKPAGDEAEGKDEKRR